MTANLAQAYAENGYIVVRNLFNEQEVGKYKEEARKVIDEKQNLGKVGNEGVYVGMAIASPVFKEAAGHPALAEALKAIIGNDVVFLSDKIVYKDAAKDFGSPWHQDHAYWFGSNKVSVWVPLDDATPENGCLRIVPGSHLLGTAHHGGDSSDGLGFINRLNAEEIEAMNVVDMPVSRGDVIIFHDLLYHASYPNTSGRDRWALISTYKDGTKEDPAYSWAGAAFKLS